jgi:hypothetical protein
MAKARSQKPKMTADDARTFKTFSIGNATAIAEALQEKGCMTCLPYEDVFTFNRWKALGYHVKKGEHGMRIPVINEVEKEDQESGEVVTRKLFHTSVVFCRHQVEVND